MIIDNKIEKTFSGPLVIIGITFMLSAIILVLNHYQTILILGAVFCFMIACFLLFTYSGIIIDTENRKIKPYYMLFGLFKRGKWQSLEKFLGLTLVPMKKVYSTYSRSNRKNFSSKNEFRVYLVNKAKKPAFPLKSCKTVDDAQNSMDEFSIWLKLPVYSVKKHF